MLNKYQNLNPNVFITELQVDALSKLRPAKKLSYRHDYASPFMYKTGLLSMFPSLSHDMARGYNHLKVYFNQETKKKKHMIIVYMCEFT